MVQMTFSDDIESVARDIKNCKRCRLHEERTNTVPGIGSSDADIMFIGEAPGKNEDEKGEPFVGRAGELLDRLLDSVGLSREDVFIANVVKCRPPNNRNPRKDEIDACHPYLHRQIDLIKPKVICTLGNHATDSILGKTGISKIHGKRFELDGYTVVPLYHPAAGLYNPNLVEDMKKDIEQLK